MLITSFVIFNHDKICEWIKKKFISEYKNKSAHKVNVSNLLFAFLNHEENAWYK